MNPRPLIPMRRHVIGPSRVQDLKHTSSDFHAAGANEMTNQPMGSSTVVDFPHDIDWANLALPDTWPDHRPRNHNERSWL